MIYTDYGKTGLKVSRFGLGCMRFPAEEKDAIEMVRYALDNGVNYLDTAYVYKDSEPITGKALRDGYRDKTYLATKSPLWNINKHEDFEKYLDESLQRLGTDHIDVYLLHNLCPEHWDKVVKYDALAFLDNMIKKGKIRHKAFSFHSTLDIFKKIVDAYDWDMAQIQLNILDTHQQAGLEGLKYAAAKGLATVVMEPLRGGSLLNNAPPEVQDLIQAHPEKRTLVDWCFRWLFNMPEVSVVISGASTLDQLKDSLRIFDDSRAGVLSESDLELIFQIKNTFESKRIIGCTGCQYCMPCPQEVNIPEIFKLYNSSCILNAHPLDGLIYQNTIVPRENGADQCVSCELCSRLCPQGLAIPELLQQAHEELSKPLVF